MEGKADEAEQEYTIDELSAAAGVPSRTIRFYQSSGALPRPEIRGRVAYYGAQHLERLKLVADLQDRGLRMKAISELLQKVDKGEVDLREWLGLEEQIEKPWLEDESKTLTKDELTALIGEPRRGLTADLVRLGLIGRMGRLFFVRSPGLLKVTMQLEAAGVDLETAYEGAGIMRKHCARAAKELTKHFFKRTATGFGRDASAEEIVEAIGAVRPLGQEALRLIFAQEMDKVLQEFVKKGTSGIIPKVKARRKK